MCLFSDLSISESTSSFQLQTLLFPDLFLVYRLFAPPHLATFNALRRNSSAIQNVQAVWASSAQLYLLRIYLFLNLINLSRYLVDEFQLRLLFQLLNYFYQFFKLKTQARV